MNQIQTDISLVVCCTACNVPTVNPFMFFDNKPHNCMHCWTKKYHLRKLSEIVDYPTQVMMESCLDRSGDYFYKMIRCFDSVSVRFYRGSDERGWYFGWVGRSTPESLHNRFWVILAWRESLSWEEYYNLVMNARDKDNFAPKKVKYKSHWWWLSDVHYFAWFANKYRATIQRYLSWNYSEHVSDEMRKLESTIDISIEEINETLLWNWSSECIKKIILHAKENNLSSSAISKFTSIDLSYEWFTRKNK